MSSFDNFRINWAMWRLDIFMTGIPGRERRAIRNEVQANLRASAAEVGTAEAVRRLGSLRRLGASYLDAEYGEGRPRPSLWRGIFWESLVGIFLIQGSFAALSAFMRGLEARPGAEGTFVWDEMATTIFWAEVTYQAGHLDNFALHLSWHPLLYVLVAFLLGGRFWRVLPLYLRRYRRRATAKIDMASGR